MGAIPCGWNSMSTMKEYWIPPGLSRLCALGFFVFLICAATTIDIFADNLDKQKLNKKGNCTYIFLTNIWCNFIP